jgi:nucleotide-binding universal stress UspA family protein
MIPEIRKILYTTDISDNSEFAFRHAINSAKKHDAHITILHVIEKLPKMARALVETQLGEDKHHQIVEETVDTTKDKIMKRLKMFCETELKSEPECIERIDNIEVCEGFPPEVILRKADELGCDAIIMGTHGKGIMEHTFLGSVAQQVLRRTRKPVFIIPLPENP